ncbi:hypothetical protein HCU01_42100 [Halomonas cupida]|uniref:Uncharacterized protein n=1 Tax=Halomonas cupida TaxID=44933 RepID=A0A1M7LV51_9GAMM|nr:hypothetical protein [Halomonas cupida]GEN26261.1 hypothetical protein HCU01_42100 [Halomonas cupida]SHM82100.1 hypothetical protein SAMN05660971_03954 [Halomonas cupida]
MKDRLNICVLSNSHAGSLKQGWDRMCKNHPSIEVTFFAQRSHGMKDLEVVDDKLLPGNKKLGSAIKFTSKGKDLVDPKEYDVFLIYGLGLQPITNNINGYSEEFLKEAVDDYVKKTILYATYAKLTSITNKKIFLSHNPLRSYNEPFVNKPLEYYYDGIRLLNDCGVFREGDEVIPQPEETIEGGYKTSPVYCNGSVKVEVGDRHDGENHDKSDLFHMNGKFGEVWMRNFLASF